MGKRSVMCLCHSCRQCFRDACSYSVRRVVFPQETKDICSYCQRRMGYDYYLEPRKRKGGE